MTKGDVSEEGQGIFLNHSKAGHRCCRRSPSVCLEAAELPTQGRSPLIQASSKSLAPLLQALCCLHVLTTPSTSSCARPPALVVPHFQERNKTKHVDLSFMLLPGRLLPKQTPRRAFKARLFSQQPPEENFAPSSVCRGSEKWSRSWPRSHRRT